MVDGQIHSGFIPLWDTIQTYQIGVILQKILFFLTHSWLPVSFLRVLFRLAPVCGQEIKQVFKQLGRCYTVTHDWIGWNMTGPQQTARLMRFHSICYFLQASQKWILRHLSEERNRFIDSFNGFHRKFPRIVQSQSSPIRPKWMAVGASTFAVLGDHGSIKAAWNRQTIIRLHFLLCVCQMKERCL